MKTTTRWICILAAVVSLALGATLVSQTPAIGQGMSSKPIRIDVDVQESSIVRAEGSSQPYLELNTAYHQGALYSLLVAGAEVQLFRGDFMREMIAASKAQNPVAAQAGLDLPPDIDVSRADGVRHWDLSHGPHPILGKGVIALAGADVSKWARDPGHGQPIKIMRCAQDLSRGFVWYLLPDVRVRDPGGPIQKGINLWNPTSHTLSYGGVKGRWEEALARSKTACLGYDARPYQNGLFVGSFSWADLEAAKRIDLATDYETTWGGAVHSSYENHIHIAVTIGAEEQLDELIVLPEKRYDSWLPVPGPDEGTPGPLPLTFTLELRGKGQKPPGHKVVKFEIKLRDTSRQPGIALNMPLAPAAKPGPDLQFLAEGGTTVSDEGQSATVPSPDGKTGTITIAAFDGGAWSTFTAEAVLEGGSRIPHIQGHLEKPDGPTEILLPKRSPGSKIASSWLAANGNPRDAADEETTPGNAHPGDGLSAYEEYRGLVVKGEHKRLDPRKKELLIEVPRDLSNSVARGIALFAAASGITVIELNPGELAPDRVVNRNAGNAHLLPQHGLRLLKENLPRGVLGRNEPEGKTGKTPKDSERVVFDLAQIKSAFDKQATEAAAAHLQLPFTPEEYLAATIAHEIAHGVGGDHHGPSSNQPTNYTAYPPGGSNRVYRIYGSDGIEIRTRPFEIVGRVGLIGGEESGDLSCLMGYTDMYQWAFSQGDDGALVYRAVPFLKVGSRFCTSLKGTGINAERPGPSFFGDAKEGNCAAKLRVRD
jgi:hypothetical protein